MWADVEDEGKRKKIRVSRVTKQRTERSSGANAPRAHMQPGVSGALGRKATIQLAGTLLGKLGSYGVISCTIQNKQFSSPNRTRFPRNW